MRHDILAKVGYLGTEISVTDLTSWAASHQRIGLYSGATGEDPWASGFEIRQLCFGAEDGTAFVVNGLNKDLCRKALRAVKAAGMPMWAHDATFAALAVANTYSIWLTDLRCSRIAARRTWPREAPSSELPLVDLRPKAAFAQDRLRRRWIAAGGAPVSKWHPRALAGLPLDEPEAIAWGSTHAIETARLVEDVYRNGDPAQRAGIRAECQLDEVWRRVTAGGFRVDERLLEQKISRAAAIRQESTRLWGVDVTVDGTDTRTWLERRRIEWLDPAGKPTLSAKHLKSAVVPDEHSADWELFTSLRSGAATEKKLTEIAAALRNGRVHPTIDVNGAVTGRMNITKPALQNVTPTLRGLFLAEEGTVLIGCDLDRVEPKVAAALSQDSGLRKAVAQDLYVELAVAVRGEKARQDPASRALAKTAFLAQLYGQGTSTLARSLEVSEDEAAKVVAGLRYAYPQLLCWIASARRSAERSRPLTTITGRPLPPTPKLPYRAANWIIQGSAADLFKACTLRAVERLGPDALWLPIHDELIVQVEDDPASIRQGLSGLQDAMTTICKGITIGGDATFIGERWAKVV